MSTSIILLLVLQAKSTLRKSNWLRPYPALNICIQCIYINILKITSCAYHLVMVITHVFSHAVLESSKGNSFQGMRWFSTHEWEQVFVFGLGGCFIFIVVCLCLFYQTAEWVNWLAAGRCAAGKHPAGIQSDSHWSFKTAGKQWTDQAQDRLCKRGQVSGERQRGLSSFAWSYSKCSISLLLHAVWKW